MIQRYTVTDTVNGNFHFDGKLIKAVSDFPEHGAVDRYADCAVHTELKLFTTVSDEFVCSKAIFDNFGDNVYRYGVFRSLVDVINFFGYSRLALSLYDYADKEGFYELANYVNFAAFS